MFSFVKAKLPVAPSYKLLLVISLFITLIITIPVSIYVVAQQIAAKIEPLDENALYESRLNSYMKYASESAVLNSSASTTPTR